MGEGMPSRYQPDVRKWIYLCLILRDGERCFHCNRKPSKKRKLEIDHADNNPANDAIENLHLLCRSCNLMFRGKSTYDHIRILQMDSAKNGGERGKVDITVSKINLGYGNGSPEMQSNLCYEAKVNDWVLKMIDEHKGSITRKEAINGGSAFAGCSPNTATRYIDKMTSEYEGVLVEYRENNQTRLKRKEFNEKLSN
jgi:hypothetical protein